MKKEFATLPENFEAHAQQTEDGAEYWLARDVQDLLGYAEGRNFTTAISRAKTVCEMSGHSVGDHFIDVTKMVDVDSESAREIDDVRLTRYACSLVAQIGLSKKEEITFAQREMRAVLPAISLTLCGAAAAIVVVLFFQAAQLLAGQLPNRDPQLQRLVSTRGWWLYAVAPYAAFAAVAVAFRKRSAASLLVLCVTAPAVLFGVADTYEYLKPLPPGGNSFARGLGYVTPLGLSFVAAVLGVAIKAISGLWQMIKYSEGDI